MKASCVARLVVVLSFASCTENPAGSADSGPADLMVTTAMLPPAQVGEPYSFSLAAEGGRPPYVWNLGAHAAGASWLALDSATGALSGIPAAAARGLSVEVTVTDADARSASGTFSLNVDACVSGTKVRCRSGAGGACVVGEQACVNGSLAAACVGAASSDVAVCGTRCGPCGAAGDSCVAGECSCGGGSGCGTGQGCCGGACVSLESVSHCGACGTDCSAGLGPHTAAACVSGTCSFSCLGDYLNCGAPGPAGCTANRLYDATHCGSCDVSCLASGADGGLATGTCANGQCVLTCVPGRYDCDGLVSNGCEQFADPTHCGSCQTACVPAGSYNVVTANCVLKNGVPTCDPVCLVGYARCDSLAGACVTSLNTNPFNCGACGTVCPGTTDRCLNGSCHCGFGSPCPAGKLCYSGNCL